MLGVAHSNRELRGCPESALRKSRFGGPTVVISGAFGAFPSSVRAFKAESSQTAATAFVTRRNTLM